MLGEQPDVVRALAEELRVLEACGAHQCAHRVESRQTSGARQALGAKHTRLTRAPSRATQAGDSGDCRVGQ